MKKSFKGIKTLFLALIVLLVASGCNQNSEKAETASTDSTNMHSLYEENLAVYKTQIAAFEKEDLDAWAATVADSAFWSSPFYGDTVSTKAHWVESTKNVFDNFNNLHLTDPQFLPGVDSATQQPDGSVRYYGTWHGTASSGQEVKLKVYGTYDFNADHKVIFGADYYDAGGMRNALKTQ